MLDEPSSKIKQEIEGFFGMQCKNVVAQSYLCLFFYILLLSENLYGRLRRKMTRSMVTRKFHLVAAKKGMFKLLYICSRKQQN